MLNLDGVLPLGRRVHQFGHGAGMRGAVLIELAFRNRVVHLEVPVHVEGEPCHRCFAGQEGGHPAGFPDAHVFGRFVFEF